MTADITATLEERRANYGDYATKASFIQSLKFIIRDTPNWTYMEGDMQESIDMIFTKLGRIAYGHPTHADSWHDIIGYAKLIEDRLKP